MLSRLTRRHNPLSFVSLILLLAMAFLCAGCQEDAGEKTPAAAKDSAQGPAQTSARAGRTLVYASTKDIRDINPHLYGGEMAAQGMVFESLVTNTTQGVQPCLATSWEISEDGTIYTFFLRKDVRFSDGTPFDAEAVRLNIEAVLANRLRHAWLDLVNEIDRCEVVDSHTVRLVLRHAYYPTLVELGMMRPFRFISPKCFVNGGTAGGVSGLAGTGPWILSEHRLGEYALFTANPGYWGEKPRIDSVRWKVVPDHQAIILSLQKGEIDLVFGSDGDMFSLDNFEALKAMDRFATAQSQPIASRAILVNAHQHFTKERAVRIALQYAVDRQAIVDGLLNGSETRADTLLSPEVLYCDVPLDIRSHDPAKAARLLDEAGWVMGADGVREKGGDKAVVRLAYNANNAQEKSIGEFLQANLKALGIEIRLLGEEKQAFLDRQKSGDFEMQYSLSWGTPYDPQSYVSSWRLPAHGDYQAQVGLERKEWLDGQITRLMTERDEQVRRELYRDILTYVHNEGVYIPLSYSRTRAVFVKELSGVSFGLSQYEIPFEKMFFADKAR